MVWKPVLAACAVLAGLTAAGISLAQTPTNKTATNKTEARFAGGFYPDACRWPREARAQQLSGCCQMDLEIDATGRMVAGNGVCSDPMFLEPTLRCLAAQDFIPATRNGMAVSDLQQLEYEWRATKPSGNMCSKLKTS
ncbi:MAG: hypothetical protein B7Z38_02315 [Rhodobacterales bacterium 12-64-8]|nr:MAG: hypothetical protein B7Z38_02315 [Rhodobacterales bacterium 12-64-8]